MDLKTAPTQDLKDRRDAIEAEVLQIDRQTGEIVTHEEARKRSIRRFAEKMKGEAE